MGFQYPEEIDFRSSEGLTQGGHSPVDIISDRLQIDLHYFGNGNNIHPVVIPEIYHFPLLRGKLFQCKSQFIPGFLIDLAADNEVFSGKLTKFIIEVVLHR